VGPSIVSLVLVAMYCEVEHQGNKASLFFLRLEILRWFFLREGGGRVYTGWMIVKTRLLRCESASSKPCQQRRGAYYRSWIEDGKAPNREFRLFDVGRHARKRRDQDGATSLVAADHSAPPRYFRQTVRRNS